MTFLELIFILLVWAAVAFLGYKTFHGTVSFIQSRERLMAEYEPADLLDVMRAVHKNRLRFWLYGAGYESIYAPWIFLLAAGAFAGVGALTVYVILKSSFLYWAASGLESIPGNIGQIFVPVLFLAPYLLFFLVSALPWAHVARNRTRRTEKIEEDLPVFLEYLVTLSEAGLGFDEALGRVLEVRKDSRPLQTAFKNFRQEILSGSSRISAYWRLRNRLQTSSVKTLVSALLQSEQAGGSIAGILRLQAADALTRRRMRALELAYTLPVKLLFPMMCCFLPGLMAVILGPLLYRMIQSVDSLTRTIRG